MVKYGLFELCCKLTVCYSAFWNFFRRKLGDVEICPYMVKCPYLVFEAITGERIDGFTPNFYQ